jgi:hypothetical protein
MNRLLPGNPETHDARVMGVWVTDENVQGTITPIEYGYYGPATTRRHAVEDRHHTIVLAQPMALPGA